LDRREYTCKTAKTVDIATTDTSVQFCKFIGKIAETITTGTKNKKTGTSNTRVVENIAFELNQCMT